MSKKGCLFCLFVILCSIIIGTVTCSIFLPEAEGTDISIKIPNKTIVDIKVFGDPILVEVGSSSNSLIITTKSDSTHSLAKKIKLTEFTPFPTTPLDENLSIPGSRNKSYVLGTLLLEQGDYSFKISNEEDYPAFLDAHVAQDSNTYIRVRVRDSLESYLLSIGKHSLRIFIGLVSFVLLLFCLSVFSSIKLIYRKKTIKKFLKRLTLILALAVIFLSTFLSTLQARTQYANPKEILVPPDWILSIDISSTQIDKVTLEARSASPFLFLGQEYNTPKGCLDLEEARADLLLFTNFSGFEHSQHYSDESYFARESWICVGQYSWKLVAEENTYVTVFSNYEEIENRVDIKATLNPSKKALRRMVTKNFVFVTAGAVLIALILIGVKKIKKIKFE
jgi:hypothetical protein